VLSARLVEGVNQRDMVEARRGTSEFFRIAQQPIGALRVESEFLAVGNLTAEIRAEVGLADRCDSDMQTPIVIVAAIGCCDCIAVSAEALAAAHCRHVLSRRLYDGFAS
jgi:hypothetical protein